jgi:hypothetical protein
MPPPSKIVGRYMKNVKHICVMKYKFNYFITDGKKIVGGKPGV